MISRKNIGILAGIVGVLASATTIGCSADSEDNADQAEGAATAGGSVWTVGQPKVVAMGDQIGSAFVFKADLAGKPLAAPLTRAYVSAGGGGYNVTGYGTLVATPNVTNGVFSKDAWDCDKAEEFATGKSSGASGQKCYVELVPTGGNTGFGLAIAGLDASGQGLTSYNSTGARPAPAASSHLASAGPMTPYSINVKLDPNVLESMKELKTHYSASESEKNSCIKNARAASWLDIQSHYYCNIAYNVRECYSGKLIEDSQSADPKVRGAAAGTAYAKCFVGAAGAPPVDTFINADAKRAATFKYVMFTKQGVIDFNIESENEVINKFYGSTSARPRRITDTIPAFLNDQPRYEAVRQTQIAGQAAGKTAAAAAPAKPDGGV